MEYNKKQMAPLIEKYQIDVETNQLFKNIVTMFDSQPNYQLWAVKCVFSKAITYDFLVQLKEWIDNNTQNIKSLSKQNIVAYSTIANLDLLKKEMKGIDMMSFLNHSFSKFNTRQRELLRTKILPNGTTPLEFSKSSTAKAIFDKFTKFERLPMAKKNNVYVASSSFNTVDEIIVMINGCLSETYEWNKEDMLAFMANNTRCEVVKDNGDIVVLKVPDYKSSNLMCGNGRTTWCITKQEHYFSDYVTSHTSPKREQFFLFDFSRPETHELAHVGFTLEIGNGITNAHSCLNNSLVGGSTINVDGKRVGINDVLRMDGVSLSELIKISMNSNFKWGLEYLLEYVEEHADKYKVKAVKGNVAIVEMVLTADAFTRLLGNTLLSMPGITSSYGSSSSFVIFNFDMNYDKEDSVVLVSCSKDEYGIMSIQEMKNSMNTRVDNSILSAFGVSSEDFLNRANIDPKIMLHKLIDEKDEKGVLKLIKEQGASFDVNYAFKDRLPILSVMHSKMFSAFEAIISHPMYNICAKDNYGETLLETLIYYYGNLDIVQERIDKESIERMLKITLAVGERSYNEGDLNNDTALMIACEHPNTDWVIEALVKSPRTDVNKVNDFGYTALTNLIMRKNFNGINILASRADLDIRKEDVQMARDYGFELPEVLKSTSKEVAVSNA